MKINQNIFKSFSLIILSQLGLSTVFVDEKIQLTSICHLRNIFRTGNNRGGIYKCTAQPCA